MRQRLLKLRHYLIKKLGGYTEQKIVIDIRPVVFRHNMKISMCVPLNEANLHAVLNGYKRELAVQIANSLIKADMVKVECLHNSPRYEMNLSARLYVVSPHDAAMCGL